MGNVLYSKYNRTRMPKYQTCTKIIETEEGRAVVKSALTEEAKEYIAEFPAKYEIIKNSYANLTPIAVEFSNGDAVFPYIEGQSLAAALEQERDVESRMLRMKEFLTRALEIRPEYIRPFEITKEFTDVFGSDVEQLCGMPAVQGADIDLIFENIIQSNDGWNVIDYEWTYDFLVPVDFIKFRCLYYYYCENNKFFQEKDVDEYMAFFDIDEKNKDIFMQMDDSFQQLVHGKNRKNIYTSKYMLRSHDLYRSMYQNQAIDDELEDVARKNQEITDKARHIANLEAMIEQRNAENTQLEKAIEALGNEIGNYKNEIEDCKHEIGEYAKIVVDREARIQKLTQERDLYAIQRDQYQKHYEEIQNSRIWRSTKVVRKAANVPKCIKEHGVKYTARYALAGKTAPKHVKDKRKLDSNKFERGEEKVSEIYSIIQNDDNLKNAVDSISYSSDEKKVSICGWAFDIEGGETEFDSVEYDICVKRRKRDDVFAAFEGKYENARYSGYEIELKKVGKHDFVEIKITTISGTSILKVDVKKLAKCQKNDNVAFAKSLMSRKNLVDAKNYLKKYGFKKTLIRIRVVLKNKNKQTSKFAYEQWRNLYENYNVQTVKKEIDEFRYKPKFSICIPVYNVEEKWLRMCIDSVLAQFYDNWQLCLADDCSTMKHVKRVLDEYAEADKRINVVYRTENGHISKATNSAIDIAIGDYMVLMDNDDVIPQWALYEVAKLINEHPEADVIYSNEDKISVDGVRSDPFFKPAYSPDMILSCNYISHLGVYRMSLVREIGGFRAGYEGSQDYDLVLRITEKTDNVFHIPKFLYHWRVIEGSTALDVGEKNYAYTAGFRALEDTIKRRNYNATLEELTTVPFYYMNFKPDRDYLISIIIPTKDKADVLERCLKSIYEKTSYKNFEVIIVNNNSVEKVTFELFERYKKYGNFKVLNQNIEFNYSKLNNNAVKISNGELILFLNNDIEVISPDWLEKMAGEACRKEVGAVGVKLLYPNDTIQHGGIVLLDRNTVAAHMSTGLLSYDTGYFGALDITRNYSAVTAACLMIRKDIFNQIGGFEEDLAVAYNDVDLCLKAMKAGYNNVFIGGVKLYHYESLSRGAEDSTENLKRLQKETDYMVRKWGELIDNDPYFNPDSGLRLLDFKMRGRS